MKLAILSTSPRCYSTMRFRQAAKERGHEVKVLNTLRFGIDLQHGEPDLYFRGKQLSDYDAILPRIGASITFFGMPKMTAVCSDSAITLPPKRLTAAGLIEESGDRPAADDDQRRRCYYRLTGRGSEAVREEASRLAALVRVAEAKHLLDPEPRAVLGDVQ